MALSIKDEYADSLAREVAATHGLTLTGAVTLALERQVAQDKKKKEAEVARKIAAIQRIQQRVRKAYGNKPIPSSTALMESLYDESGLPK